MSALTVDPGITMHSRGPAVPNPTMNKSFFSLTIPLILPYRDFSTTIFHRTPLFESLDSHSDIYNRIVQPYNPDAFELLLRKHNLTFS